MKRRVSTPVLCYSIAFLALSPDREAHAATGHLSARSSSGADRGSAALLSGSISGDLSVRKNARAKSRPASEAFGDERPLLYASDATGLVFAGERLNSLSAVLIPSLASIDLSSTETLAEVYGSGVFEEALRTTTPTPKSQPAHFGLQRDARAFRRLGLQFLDAQPTGEAPLTAASFRTSSAVRHAAGATLAARFGGLSGWLPQQQVKFHAITPRRVVSRGFPAQLLAGALADHRAFQPAAIGAPAETVPLPSPPPVAAPPAAARVLSDFSDFNADAPAFDQSWLRNGTKQLAQQSGFASIAPVSGGNPQDDGQFLVYPASADYSLFRFIEITAREDAGNFTASFNFRLEDKSGGVALIPFTIASFGNSFSTLSAPLPTLGLDLSNILSWGIATGSSPSADFRLSFDNIALVVPEPSTSLLLFIGAGLIARRTKRHC